MPNTNPLEKEVQAEILKWLNSRPNIWAWRRPVGMMRWKNKQGGQRFSRFGMSGQSDIEGVVRVEMRDIPTEDLQWVGVHLEVECKRKGEEPTKPQAAWLMAMNAAGGIAEWAHSVAMLECKLKMAFKERGWDWEC